MSQTKAQLISDLVQALNFTGTSSAPANGMYLSAANTIKLATNSNPRLTIDSSGNVSLPDDKQIQFGGAANGDFRIWHQAADNRSYIWEGGSGALCIQGSYVKIQSPQTDPTDASEGEEDLAVFKSDGAAELYWGGASPGKKFETTQTGATITGTCTATTFVGALTGTASSNAVLTGSTNNTIATVTGANAIQGEANLTFDGSDLALSRSDNAAGGISVTNTNNAQGSGIAQLALSGGDNAYANISLECNGSNHHIKNDGSGNFDILDGTTNRLRINANGEIGINTLNPGDYYAETLVITAGSEEGITINRGTNSGANYIMFAEGTSGEERYRGYISYTHNATAADGLLSLAANGSSRANIKGNGDVEILDGNLIVANGHGINFSAQTGTSATGAATGNSPAEVLDHYEEGTWTPTFTGSTGNPTLSGQIVTGIYTKVGNLVTVTYYSGSFTLSGSPGGTPYIGGLPFAAKSTGNNYATAYFAHTTCFNADACGYVNNGGSLITVLQTGDTTAGNTWESSGTRYLMVHFTYLAA